MSSGPTLYDYWLALYGRRWSVLLVFISSCLFALGLSSLLPPVYEAKASIYIPRESGKVLYTGQAQEDLAQAPALPTPDEKSAGTSIGILKSKTIARRVQKQFPDKVLEDLMKNTDVVVGSEFLTEIYVRDRDPRLAAAIANAYVDAYEGFQADSMAKRSDRTSKVLEQQLRLVSEQLTENKLRAREFEGRRTAGELTRETRDLGTELENARADLAALKQRQGTGESVSADRVAQNIAEERVRSLETALRNLEQSGTTLSSRFIEQETTKQRTARLTVLKETLEKRLVEARLQQRHPPPSVIVAEEAMPPEKPSFPLPVLNTIVAGFLGLAVGCYYALFLEYLSGLKRQRARRNIEWEPEVSPKDDEKKRRR